MATPEPLSNVRQPYKNQMGEFNYDQISPPPASAFAEQGEAKFDEANIRFNLNEPERQEKALRVNLSSKPAIKVDCGPQQLLGGEKIAAHE